MTNHPHPEIEAPLRRLAVGFSAGTIGPAEAYRELSALADLTMVAVARLPNQDESAVWFCPLHGQSGRGPDAPVARRDGRACTCPTPRP